MLTINKIMNNQLIYTLKRKLSINNIMLIPKTKPAEIDTSFTPYDK